MQVHMVEIEVKHVQGDAGADGSGTSLAATTAAIAEVQAETDASKLKQENLNLSLSRYRVKRPLMLKFNAFWIKVISSMWFDLFIILAILVAVVLIGARTYDSGDQPADTDLRSALDAADATILVIFSIEVVVKMLAKGPLLYFTVYWNIFDFSVVLMTFLPLEIDVVIFRLLRLLRVAKLVKAFPQLQVILIGLQQGLQSILYNAVLLFLCMWMFAIFGMVLFRANDPLHFGTLHISLFTLFRVATLEDWTDIMYVNIYGCGETGYGYPFKNDTNNSHPLTGYKTNTTLYTENVPCFKSEDFGFWAALYFIIYVVIAGLVMLSIFIGVVTSAMDDATAKIAQEKR